jgi:manganese efflux pump family protein
LSTKRLINSIECFFGKKYTQNPSTYPSGGRMNFLTLMITAVALSTDAFAASLSCGCTMEDFKHDHCFFTAVLFGLFQALMPLAGWLGASFLQGGIFERMDHWIAFFLLAAVGCKMIWESLKPEKECKDPEDVFHIKNLLGLAVATSIDALAIGITFSLLGYPILIAAPVIGLTTFILSYLGVRTGHKLNHFFGERMETLGGVVLILIGLRILFTL